MATFQEFRVSHVTVTDGAWPRDIFGISVGEAFIDDPSETEIVDHPVHFCPQLADDEFEKNEETDVDERERQSDGNNDVYIMCQCECAAHNIGDVLDEEHIGVFVLSYPVRIQFHQIESIDDDGFEQLNENDDTFEEQQKQRLPASRSKELETEPNHG